MTTATQHHASKHGAEAQHHGVDRWPVRTGTDHDAGKVRVRAMEAGDPVTVQTTVEEMIKLRRAADMPPVTERFPAHSYYQDRRAAPVEVTLYRVPAWIVAVKLERDGDYHLILQGESGATMVGEIPNPTPRFEKNHAWRPLVEAARAALDAKLGGPLKPVDFKRSEMGVPRKPGDKQSSAAEAPAMTAVSLKATVTGVGFFDSLHGQPGAAPTAIELHPILKLEFD